MILPCAQGLRFHLFGAVVDAEADFEQHKARRQAPKLATRLVSEASRAEARWTVKDVDKPY